MAQVLFIKVVSFNQFYFLDIFKNDKVFSFTPHSTQLCWECGATCATTWSNKVIIVILILFEFMELLNTLIIPYIC